MKSTHGVVRLAYLKTILANGHTILKLYTYGHTNVTLYILELYILNFCLNHLNITYTTIDNTYYHNGKQHTNFQC
jgi:hypothetical protein